MDSEEFARKVNALWNQLYNFSFAQCRDHHLAEDVVQDTIRLAVDKMKQYRGNSDESLRGWVFTIARNLLKDIYRKKRPELLGEHDATIQSTMDLSIFIREREFSSVLNGCIGAVYDKYAEAISFFFSTKCAAREVIEKFGLDLTEAGWSNAWRSKINSLRRCVFGKYNEDPDDYEFDLGGAD